MPKSADRAISSIFWNGQEILGKDYLEKERPSTFLERLKKKILETKPQMKKSMNGVELLPPYSSDLSANNYYLFAKIKDHIYRKEV